MLITLLDALLLNREGSQDTTFMFLENLLSV